MIKIVFTFFLFFFVFSKAKGQDTLNCRTKEKLPIAENVTAYIKGKKGKTKIQWKYFYPGFELKLTDESYQIQTFHLTWDVYRLNNTMLVSRNNKGSFVQRELSDTTNVADKSIFSLTSIPPGSLITIDYIIAIKNEICYKIPSVAFSTVLKRKEEN